MDNKFLECFVDSGLCAKINGDALKLLILLDAYADDAKIVSVSRQRISDASRVKGKAIDKAIKQLVKLCLIEIISIDDMIKCKLSIYS